MVLWGGRFSKELNQQVLAFTRSLDLDKRLYPYDIKGSIAHAQGLSTIGILTKKEYGSIRAHLEKIKRELDKGTFVFHSMDEDIHMAIERRLIEMIGNHGRKLHTGRSRNDQVVCDMKLYMKDVLKDIDDKMQILVRTFVDRAKKDKKIIMPGYTHLQQAQPVLFAQYLLAYRDMFVRDQSRYNNVSNQCDSFPLGSGALAGTPYAYNRKTIAKKLGFNRVTSNSMDAVSDRDFVLDFLYASAVFCMHTSRLAEDFIIYSSQEFGFIELDDAYTTGSSIMPQKKNPDVLELMRGRSERVITSLNACMNVMKALPMTYNRDMQEDKFYLFTTLDVVRDFLTIMPDMIRTMSVRPDRMKQALDHGYIYATALADYLVHKGVPFRSAHHITGRIVRYALEHNKIFSALSFEELRSFSDTIDRDVFSLFNGEGALRILKSDSSTSYASVEKQLKG